MKTRPIHPWPVRLTHWVNAVGMVCMFMSGWSIYNASPLMPFTFPKFLTLGGWLGGSIAWHFAVMWLLVINGLLYVLYGVFSRHFKRDLLPVRPSEVKRDMSDALHFRLAHVKGRYNAVQRLMYWLVLIMGVLVVVSGLAIWKPVQFQGLVALLGGFDFARWVHFGAMTAIGAFVVVHLVLVVLVPSTLLPMITGGRQPNEDGTAQP
ncbi:HupC/HyaC/HydC family protein [Pseudomonas syringae pv. broussonetiae]|uniref:HupC/HyaC/HydC protein n=1 Tax=Pseudomonas savastanoi TaxID=29438 RepID=A0A3M5BQY5_PSESS|nr:cytochrome b/b6 domain-containing protein [Pseudomonas savastanoi]KPW63740.1 HupC/HyaC/HydC family protein [Pseudomonas syringae pv. broussonetiae]KWT14432.1 thioredoxin reductase [Pseudomonas syringae pv. broussonetiae]RMS27017.1 HupC/HyaC/HydC protein [Pseudomonas savastanoi]RMT19372.1 HupC/HyaC/HydC protein [Pseudomonas savastanoi]